MINREFRRESRVVTVSLIPIPAQIAAAERELSGLLAYPQDMMVEIIREVGFRCDCCGRCCTRAFNGHVFLLDSDARRAREIDPGSVEPAPDPEFCDQNGTFYVSGFALRAMDDNRGSCFFLDEDNRCRIYDNRFSICRVYPYLLHREPDERGKLDWRQISGLNEHGEYHTEIPVISCHDIAAQTREYEAACIRQQIAFLRYIRHFFSLHNLRHVQKIYDDRMRAFATGGEIRVMVFYNNQLEEHHIRNKQELQQAGHHR